MRAEESVAAVQEFLEQRVRPQLTSELRGELRAAGKILGEVVRQMRQEPTVDRDDCAELLDGLEHELGRGLVSLDSHVVADLRDRLRGCDAAAVPELRAEVIALTDQVLNDLQTLDDERAAEALLAWYRLLERRAAARIGWQSVFTATPHPSRDLTDAPTD